MSAAKKQAPFLSRREAWPPQTQTPFLATEGLYRKPPIVNDVETLFNVPFIVDHGTEWYRQWGTEHSPGLKLFCVSGHMERPGTYELPMGAPMCTLIEDLCGRPRDSIPHAIFKASPLASSAVAWIGAITALYAATIALVQKDLKRILAYSTISQLGLMFTGVGVGAYAAGMFHLTIHAFFKPYCSSAPAASCTL